MSVVNVYLTGVGGQGTVLASQMIAEAALRDGKRALVGEIHGMAQRGGIVESLLRIGDQVRAPLFPPGDADVMLAFEPLEALRGLRMISDKTTAIVSSRPIIPVTVALGGTPYPDVEYCLRQISERVGRLCALDAEKLALEAGNRLTVSTVLLGALAGTEATGIGKEAFLAAILDMAPPRTKEANGRAFELGVRAAGEVVQTG